MANANSRDGQGNGKMRVTSLRDLPQAVQPPRDLWAGIEARIGAERQSAAEPVQSPVTRRPAQLRWLAAAAMIGTLAVGVWIGRSSLPSVAPTQPPLASTRSVTTSPAPNNAAALVQAAYLSDPRFRQAREELVKSLQARLDSLPPQSRAKVVASLETIHKSKQDLEDALGKDPTNALLQELLLNTYQDEMRVLTTVHEASDAGKGI
jgi:hypothetical protein